jgi:hypothetical protein
MLNGAANTLSVNLTTGVITPSDPISARASVTLTLTGTGSLTSSNMRAALYRLNRSGVDGTLCATCSSFTAFVGALSLNTTELLAAFTDCEAIRQGEKLRFNLLIWDASQSVYMIWDFMLVAYETAVLSTAVNVSPISTGTTLWGNLKLISGVIHLQSTTDNEWYPLTAVGQDATVHPQLGETGIA